MSDFIGLAGLALAILLVIVFVAWVWQTHKASTADSSPLPAKRRARRNPMRQVIDAEDFAKRMKDRARRDIDEPNGGNGSGKHH
jgi:hypothetical protein